MALATRDKKATSCRDNQITTTDAAIALQIAATGARNPADVGGDDRVTSLDALMIMQAAGGAIDL